MTTTKNVLTLTEVVKKINISQRKIGKLKWLALSGKTNIFSLTNEAIFLYRHGILSVLEV